MSSLNGITLLVYMLAFALGCMTLGLAIVYHLRSPHKWTGLFITFHASLLGCMVISAVQVLNNLLWHNSLGGTIINYILSSVILLATTFLVVFAPYFTTWVIAHPWRNPYRTLFYILAVAYFALGVLNLIYDFTWISLSWSGLFIFVLFFCLSVIMKNLKSIDSKPVRNVCMSIIIVAFSMIPLLVLGIIFTHLSELFVPIYFLSYTITIMVFLYMALSPRRELVAAQPESRELTLGQLEQYHITEREFSVIELISQGLTNKEIAAKLNISANTVNNHVANIFSKTEVRSRIDLLNLLKKSW